MSEAVYDTVIRYILMEPLGSKQYGSGGGTRTPDTRIMFPLLCNNGSRDRLTMVSIQQTLPNNSDLQMAKPVITIVDSDHLNAVIFSSRIWLPDSILRDNASHQSARCYIEGWV